MKEVSKLKIADKIKNLRTDNDMTQLEIARIADVSDKAVSTWERAEKEPRIGSLKKLCAHFKLDIAEFINEESDYYKEEPAPGDVLYDGDIIFHFNGETRRVRLRSEDIPLFVKLINAVDDDHDPRL